MALNHFSARHFGAQHFLTLSHNYAVVTTPALIGIIADNNSRYKQVPSADFAVLTDYIAKMGISQDITTINVVLDGSVLNIAPGSAAIIIDKQGNVTPINFTPTANISLAPIRQTLARIFGDDTIVSISNESLIIKIR